jgi:hypothetical protein
MKTGAAQIRPLLTSQHPASSQINQVCRLWSTTQRVTPRNTKAPDADVADKLIKQLMSDFERFQAAAAANPQETKK